MDIANESLIEYSIWDFKGTDPIVDQWPLMGNPIPIILIWLSYLAFIFKIGPAYMKKRPPIKLNNVLIVYNFLQVIYSAHMFSLGFGVIKTHGLFHEQCLIENEDAKKIIISGGYLYFLAKISELLDTVFFVLRKNYRQVTLLHVYHHSIMLLMSWASLKYEPAPCAIFLVTINCFVHIVMYGYYGLSAFPNLAPYLWWKKYITTLQLVQFALALIQILVDYKYSKCKPTYILLSIIVFNLIIFLYLFADFYVKNYNNNKDKADMKTNKLKSKEVDSKIQNGVNNNRAPKKIN